MGVGQVFFIEIVNLCYAMAVYGVSMFYHAWNWSKSLWCGVVVWCGGVVVWWLKPTLVFSLAQAEQFDYLIEQKIVCSSCVQRMLYCNAPV